MPSTTSGRSVLGALGAGAAHSLAREALAQESVAARPPAAFRGEHQPQPLPFDPSKLRGLSARLIRSHWENNYGGSVRALNAVEHRLAAMLRDKELPAYVYGDLKREELVRPGSVILHEHYFSNLGGDGEAAGTARELIEGSFSRPARGLGSQGQPRLTGPAPRRGVER